VSNRPRRRLPEGVTRRLDTALRWVGGIVFTLLGPVSALVEIGYAPLHWHAVRIPLTLLLAVVGNPVLVWLAVRATGWRGAWLGPAVGWCLVWFAAAFQRTEGDLLILPNNWVGVATTLLGPVAFGIAIFRLVTGSILPVAGPGPVAPFTPGGRPAPGSGGQPGGQPAPGGRPGGRPAPGGTAASRKR
jgi:hypothetical protein